MYSAVGLSHRNPTDGSSNTDYFNKTLVQQGLGSLLDQVSAGILQNLTANDCPAHAT